MYGVVQDFHQTVQDELENEAKLDFDITHLSRVDRQSVDQKSIQSCFSVYYYSGNEHTFAKVRIAASDMFLKKPGLEMIRESAVVGILEMSSENMDTF